MDLHPDIRRISGGCRQGDVLLIPVTAPAAKAKAEADVVLAHGEATGHHHTLYGRVRMFRDDGMTVAVVDGATPLRHQEHIGFMPAAGAYEARRQLEYDLREGARAVAD